MLENEIQALREQVEQTNTLLAQLLEAQNTTTAKAEETKAEKSAEKAPKKKAAKVEEPKAEEPAEEPKAEESKAEEPKAEEPEQAEDQTTLRDLCKTYLTSGDPDESDRKERKKACKRVIQACEDEDGETAKKASDVCEDHQAWAKAQVRNLIDELDSVDDDDDI